jgi:3-oxoacyl-[acyl-carrier protein] reductase
LKLKEKSIVITGANQGLGKVIARRCISEGAHILICARDGELLEHTRKELAQGAKPGQRIIATAIDVSKPDNVQDLFRKAQAELPGLDGLVNNAGIHGPRDLVQNADWQEWVSAIQINLFGTVLTCRAALPFFERQGYGKIVNLSGGGATAPMPGLSAYAASKAAIVRFTETLAEETRGRNIDVNAVAPGPMNTRMLQSVLDAGPEKVGQAFYEKSVQQKKDGGVPPERAAALCTFLLSAESDGISGKLISAIWDPWITLPERREALRQTDIYTLRRIVPQDRGQKWE